MAEGIFIIQNDGTLIELKEESYDSESILQELLAKYPSIIGGNQNETNKNQKWLLCKREMGIPDGDNLNDRWSLDHLFLDQDGIPTLVEVKRSSDTRIRREVVGQMLDYAANAIMYWPLERIQAEIETTANQSGIEYEFLLHEFLDEDQNIDEFWQRVSTNLLSGRIRMIFIADEIPKELKRIVEFLNQQMSPAEVYGIEVKQYSGNGIKSLVPQLVGVTAGADLRKSGGSQKSKQWDKQSFFDLFGERPNLKEKEIAEQLLDWSEENHLRIWWGKGAVDGSFYPLFNLLGNNHYTFCVRTGWKNTYIQIQFAQMIKPFDSIEKRRELADKIEEATGVYFSDDNLLKYPSIKLEQLDKSKTECFLNVFDWYLEECKSSVSL